MEVLQTLHPKAVENASPDPTFTNTETPMLKSTKTQQNANHLQESPRTKIYSKSAKCKLFTGVVTRVLTKLFTRVWELYYRLNFHAL